jgi:undecaprenyl-diphosphatase
MIMIENLEKIDKNLFLFINSHHNPLWDNIMWLVSNKFFWIPFYAILLFILIKKYRNSWLLLLLIIAITVLITDQTSVLIKNIVARYRPCHNLQLQNIVHIVKNHCGGMYGFVSSHSANSFGIATLIYILMKRNDWLLMYLWAILIGYSRIYLGVHYPFDVLGGAFLGIAAGIITGYIFLKISKKQN